GLDGVPDHEHQVDDRDLQDEHQEDEPPRLTRHCYEVYEIGCIPGFLPGSRERVATVGTDDAPGTCRPAAPEGRRRRLARADPLWSLLGQPGVETLVPVVLDSGVLRLRSESANAQGVRQRGSGAARSGR